MIANSSSISTNNIYIYLWSLCFFSFFLSFFSLTFRSISFSSLLSTFLSLFSFLCSLLLFHFIFSYHRDLRFAKIPNIRTLKRRKDYTQTTRNEREIFFIFFDAQLNVTVISKCETVKLRVPNVTIRRINTAVEPRRQPREFCELPKTREWKFDDKGMTVSFFFFFFSNFYAQSQASRRVAFWCVCKCSTNTCPSCCNKDT